MKIDHTKLDVSNGTCMQVNLIIKSFEQNKNLKFSFIYFCLFQQELQLRLKISSYPAFPVKQIQRSIVFENFLRFSAEFRASDNIYTV